MQNYITQGKIDVKLKLENREWIVVWGKLRWYGTYNMYIITPIDHMSHDISYFSGPRTSGAAKAKILRVYSNEIPNGIMDISVNS